MQTGQEAMRAAAKTTYLDRLEEDMTAQALHNSNDNNHTASFASTSSKPQDPERMCVVCMEREKSVVLMPCKHQCICKECVDQLKRIAQIERKKPMCPVCRELIRDTIEPFM